MGKIRSRMTGRFSVTIRRGGEAHAFTVDTAFGPPATRLMQTVAKAIGCETVLVVTAEGCPVTGLCPVANEVACGVTADHVVDLHDAMVGAGFKPVFAEAFTRGRGWEVELGAPETAPETAVQEDCGARENPRSATEPRFRGEF